MGEGIVEVTGAVGEEAGDVVAEETRYPGCSLGVDGNAGGIVDVGAAEGEGDGEVVGLV